MKIPDIVPTECLVSEEDLHGWKPPIVEADLADPDRLYRGHITPPEMALQLAYGIRNHALQKPVFDSHAERFRYGRRLATEGVMNSAVHEFGYINAIALWHEREAVIDYPNGYGSYSSIYDGYRRNMAFSNPQDVIREICDKIEKYVGYAATSCVSLDEVVNMEERKFADETVGRGLEAIVQGLLSGSKYSKYLSEEEKRRRAVSEAEEILAMYQQIIDEDEARIGRARTLA